MTFRKLLVYLLFVLFVVRLGHSQYQFPTESPLQFGINYGSGTQQVFPFDSKNYHYNTRFYKLQLNYRMMTSRKWEFRINLEPSVYQNEHRSFEYVEHTTNKGMDDTHAKLNIFNEYSLNLGLQLKYRALKNVCTYLLGSIGPSLSDIETERLNEGFAFSDILALGITHSSSFGMFDFRLSMRHVSNAGLDYPNRGYNSMSFEIGYAVPLEGRY
jgi:hypothetical protein